MKPKHRAFVNAYLTGDSQGNATKAAVAAGYSEHTAAQIGSRLLKHPEVSKAVGRKLENADLRTDAILQRLGKIIHTEPESVRAADIVSAGKVLLQVNGALKDKQQDARIIVNIGFLQHGQPAETQAVVQVIEAQATSRE